MGPTASPSTTAGRVGAQLEQNIVPILEQGKTFHS